MGFIDSYKHLEKLCGEVLNDDRRLSAYIDKMENTTNGYRYVSSWNEDLNKLKHYRWVRNQISHEPNCNESNMCEPDDELWLDSFYERIMNQTDPLALYLKATSSKKRSISPKPEPIHDDYDKNDYRSSKDGRLGIGLIVAAFAVLGILIWMLIKL